MEELRQQYEKEFGENPVDIELQGGTVKTAYMCWLEQKIEFLRFRQAVMINKIIELRLEVHHENETMFKCTGTRSVGYTHIIENLDAISGISDPPQGK